MRRWHPPSSPHGHLFLAFPTKSSKSSLSRRKPSSNPGGVDSTANRGATLALDLDEKRCSLMQMGLILALACQ